MNQEKIGKFIKKIRKDNNMTQKDFANKYGVTYQAVSNWEQGKNIPDVALLKEISKDFNVSVDELLEGGKVYKQSKKSLLLFIFLVVFIVIASILIVNNNSGFEFKTLSSNCDDFNISGSLSYNKDKTSIYINNVNYCGGNDETLYKDIECILYETNHNTDTKISSCNYKSNKKIKLENYLKEVNFVVDDYSRSCNKFSNESLYLRINATKDDGKVITYKVPLSLNKTCN